MSEDSFVVVQWKNSEPHFLVDRGVIKSKWWSQKLSESMQFASENGAKTVAGRLKYGDVEVCPKEYFTQEGK